jgi:aryl carrier-like protein
MNTSGKIDRKKLREAASTFDQKQLALYSLADTTTVKRGLSSETEKKLAALWAEVLHIDVSKDPIGADDSFLELGGDSITAMQLVGKAKDRGLNLSVPSIMKSTRLSEMAMAVKVGADVQVEAPGAAVPSSSNSSPASKPYMPFSLLPLNLALPLTLADLQSKYSISPDLVEDIYPCTALQAGLLAMSASDPDAYVLHDVYILPPGTDTDMFKAAWASVVRKTPILRTRIVFIYGVGSCQAVLDERLTWATASSVEECLESTRADFVGYGRPLSRWTLVSEPSGATKFVWSIHHSLYDSFSLGQTLSAVDHAYGNGLVVPPATPFVEFIRFLSNVDKDAELAFWTNMLADLEAVAFPPVPVGKVCAADNTVEYLSEISYKRTGVTSATILKAAWAIVVSRLSDAEEAVFGVTQFGRDVDLDGVESITGPTITTVSFSPKRRLFFYMNAKRKG